MSAAMKPHVAAILVLGVVMTGLWLWQPTLFEYGGGAQASPAPEPLLHPQPETASQQADAPASSIDRRTYGAAFLGLLLLGFIALGTDWRDWF